MRTKSLVPVKTALSIATKIVAYLRPEEVYLLANEARR